MASQDAHFVGSIPALYEEHLAPLLFEPYAQDLAVRVRTLGPQQVLEIAAGTGVVTRALAGNLDPGVSIMATDLNESMLAVGSKRLSAPSVSWQKADAQQLPFGDAGFDVAVCQFGMMFVPDKVKAYREAKRVLKASGTLVFNVWGPLLANEVSQVVTDAVAQALPDDPPRFFERTPFGYHDAQAITGELRRAGFARVEVETIAKVTLARSSDSVAIGLCQGTPLRNEIEARAPDRLGEITELVKQALAQRFGQSAFENRMEALVITATSA